MRTPTTISRIAGSTARQAKAASGREADPQLEPTEGAPVLEGASLPAEDYGKDLLTGENKSMMEESRHVI